MTTASWSTVVDHTSDAGFRAWGLELNTKFAAVGLVQTADTGQINWTTVTRPGVVNTVGGYEIWNLPGGNLFFKIEYGTGGALANPSCWLTAGQGSNGTGTLTGQLSTRVQAGLTANSIVSTVTAYQSYLCVTANCFALAWKIGSAVASTPRMHWVVGQTVDATGTVTSTGYYALWRGLAAACQLQVVRTTATAATRNATSSFCVFPGQPSASSDGANNQAYLHWLDTPAVQPALYSATIIVSELGLGNTASMTLVGTTPHTYIAFSASAETFDAAATSTPVLGGIMLWE